jgi:multidrug efflux pump subunit AcrA (membrane-fusion protein)
MRKNNVWLALASAALLAVQLPATAQTGQYDWFTVERSRGAVTVSLGGTVVPYKEVTLAAQLPGRVQMLAGIEGDSFDEGTPLVELDETELLAQRRSAIAQLANAQAELRNAGVQYQRELWSPQSRQPPGGMAMPNLFDQMFTRPMEDFMGTRDRGAERGADLFASTTRIQQAQNAILQAQSQIQAIDAKLRDTKSVAPFDGVIMKKFIEVGDTVQPGQPLLNFADVEYLQVQVDVPSRLRPGLQEGMMLQAELDVGRQAVPVRVAQIFPMADAQRHTVTVKFDLPQGVSAPGEYVKVRVPDTGSPMREAPVIPYASIRYTGSLPGVCVQGQDGLPELRLIRVGEQLGGGMVTVLSGVQAGDRVLRNPGPAGCAPRR